MREIKFRAWDKNLKHMRYSIVVQVDFLTCFNALRGRYDFMQYTGLKDKNGKEIYEGDICHIPSLGINCKVYYRQEVCAFELEYIGNPPRHDNYTLDDVSEVEIIGNIYKTPELL